jgi:peptidoglycan hydrolase-like amidase
LTVAIGVFGLFHPQAVEIEPWGASRVEVQCAGVASRTLEGRQRLRLVSDCSAAGANGAVLDFTLSIPGKIRRHYRGTLRTSLAVAELVAVVTMDLETAVASTVASESPSNAPQAMLEAQAIVTRSYFAAGASGGRHTGFEFCDTTHCQFIKDPPDVESAAARAARATVGQVLLYHDRVVMAFYAARCDGLLAPVPAERLVAGEYPYFAVRCEYCLRHPSEIPLKANARPHHHGMCQMGAADLARQGWTAARILAHYFPGTEVGGT